MVLIGTLEGRPRRRRGEVVIFLRTRLLPRNTFGQQFQVRLFHAIPTILERLGLISNEPEPAIFFPRWDAIRLGKDTCMYWFNQSELAGTHEIVYRLCVYRLDRGVPPDDVPLGSQNQLHYSRVSHSRTFKADKQQTLTCDRRENQTTWFVYIRCHETLD